MAALGPRSKGTSGTVLQVTTNAYEISQRPRGPYIHYTVFSPEIKSPRRAHEIIDRLQVDNAHLFNPRAAYDGKANLFCRRELPASSYEVCMSRDRNSERGRFIVKISQVAIIRPTDIDRLIAGPQAQTQRGSRSDANTSTMAINLLQIIVRQAPNMRHGFPPQARAFFVQRGAKDLSAGLQAWHGFFQSVRPVLGRLLINVDVANGVIPARSPSRARHEIPSYP
ncbi:hypothetical protein AcV5_006281 [Taiwanofungus camphoratus]|nr:hypothetical protein AcV5_006281 [Antrodia cinnamomea]